MKSSITNWIVVVTLTTLFSFHLNSEVKAQCMFVFTNPVSNATCPGEPDGAVSAVGFGGTPPYTCVWTDNLGNPVQTDVGLNQGQASQLNNAIGGMNYTATFTDALACSNNASIVVATDFPVCADTRVRDGYCGRTLAAYNTYIKCYPVNSATAYEFRFENSGIGYDETIQGTNNNPLITSLVFIANDPPHNTTFNVSVRAQVGGQWGPFGNVCQISSPAIATTSLRAGYCGSTANAVNSTLKAYDVAGATDYDFRFQASGYDVTVNSPDKLTNFYEAGQISAIQPNTAYTITVRGNNGAQQGTYGSTCVVTTPSNVNLLPALTDGSQAWTGSNRNGEFIADGVVLSAPQPALTMSPNPNAGNEMRLNIDLLSEGMHHARVEVYNLAGQQVYAEEFSREGQTMNAVISFDQQLESGMYMVRVNVGDYDFQEKLIVR